MNNYQCFIMTVDVDSLSSLLKFYSVKYNPKFSDEQVAVEEGLKKLLDIFGRHKIKATFFVPGEVCLKHRKIIREVFDHGHEIACHGLYHEKDEFRSKDLDTYVKLISKATKIIMQTVNVRPTGFRAPCLRMDPVALKALELCKYFYDSSFIPTAVPGYYGKLNVPMKPHFPSYFSSDVHDPIKILELPVSVNPILRIPISGAWMRNLGLSFVKLSIYLNVKLNNPIVFYIHPRDVIDLPLINGVPIFFYANRGHKSVEFVEKLISYTKSLGVNFVKAEDFARSFLNVRSS